MQYGDLVNLCAPSTTQSGLVVVELQLRGLVNTTVGEPLCGPFLVGMTVSGPGRLADGTTIVPVALAGRDTPNDAVGTAPAGDVSEERGADAGDDARRRRLQTLTWSSPTALYTQAGRPVYRGFCSRGGCLPCAAGECSEVLDARQESCDQQCPSRPCYQAGVFSARQCVYTPASAGTSCNDGNSRTWPDRCDGAGLCVGRGRTGCTKRWAENYEPSAMWDDGSCVLGGCTNRRSPRYNRYATYDGAKRAARAACTARPHALRREPFTITPSVVGRSIDPTSVSAPQIRSPRPSAC